MSDTPDKKSADPKGVLDRRLQDLHRQLREQSEKLGDFFLGVFHALDSGPTNPQFLVHAASSARLLVDELGQYRTEDGSKLGDKVEAPFNDWAKHMATLPERVSSLLGTEVSLDLHAIIVEIDLVVGWYVRSRKSGPEALRDELVRNGIIDRSMPEHVASSRQKSWSNLKGTFSKFVHGDGRSAAELIQAVDSLVAMLEDAFAPTTFEDFKRIDELAQGGGS